MNSLPHYALLILTCLIMTFGVQQSFSQDFECGAEDLLNLDVSTYDAVAQGQLNSDLALRDIAQSINFRSENHSDETIFIPVVFHIMHLPGETLGGLGTTNINNNFLLQSLNALNLIFQNQGEFDQNVGVDMNVKFCLAQADANGETLEGIVRIPTHLTTGIKINDFKHVNELKGLSLWNTDEYLNVWIVKEIIDYAGFANFPWSPFKDYHGVVIEASSLIDPYYAGLVLAHEIGHWGGLYHTFQGGCFNADCLLNGDRVCDTPPSNKSESSVNCQANSCDTDVDDVSINNPFNVDQPDNLRTYMNYGNPICRNQFTEGQRQRFRDIYFMERSSVISRSNCDEILLNVTEGKNSNIHFIMYPNLVKNQLYLEIAPQVNYQDVSISIFNISSQVVYSARANAFTHSIDVSLLPTGIYFLVLRSKDVSLSKKFVKQ